MTTLRDPALLADIDAVLKPVSNASGLPNPCYTDAEVFRFERDAVLGSGWCAIAFTSDLPEPGYALPLLFMGLPLVIVRDRNDELRVFHNVCRHRGMVLVDKPSPLRQTIRCPYHSWAYNLEGQLLSTPHIGGNDQHRCEGFDSGAISLKTVRAEVWLGMVFVNLSGNAEAFSDFLAPLIDRWSGLLGDGLESVRPAPTGSRMDLELTCNWKLAVENYCEAYHLPWVHPALNSYSPLSEHYNILIGDRMSGQGSRNYQLTSVSAEELPQLSSWPTERLREAEYISLYPNVLLGIQVDHVFAMIVQPIDESHTIERLELSFVGDGATDDRFAACRDAVMQSWKVVFNEDVFAVEGMQRGRSSPGFDGGLFTPVQDLPTHHFHNWVARRYKSTLTDS